MERRTHHKSADGNVSSRIRDALNVLLEAAAYAQQTSGDRWEFAVEIEHLTALGLSRNDYRWLVRKSLVDHRREVTLEGDDGRAFRATGDLTFPEGTCFVLTDDGVTTANGFCSAASGNVSPCSSLGHNGYDAEEGHDATVDHESEFSTRTDLSGGPSVPIWDSLRRELCIDSVRVKRFRSTAANQEMILATFEEEGWPARIDDPLSPQPEQCPKRRLSDTIKCLNRKQTNRLIHFRGDGTGEGVTWERVD